MYPAAAAAPPIESMSKMGTDILSMGRAAAAVADKAILGVGLWQRK